MKKFFESQTEFCPQCGKETEMSYMVQECEHCGELIVCCSMCNDHTKCGTCKYAKLRDKMLMKNERNKKMKKTQVNKVLSYLKKGDASTTSKKDKSKVFHYANKQVIDSEEYYCFSNKYTAYALKEDIGLPLYENLTDQERKIRGISSYPSLNRLFPDKEYYQEVKIVDYKTLNQTIKDNPDKIVKNIFGRKVYYSKITVDNDCIISINALFIKEAYKILGHNLKCYVKGIKNPILLENSNGDKAILGLLKVYNGDKPLVSFTKFHLELRVFD